MPSLDHVALVADDADAFVAAMDLLFGVEVESKFDLPGHARVVFLRLAGTTFEIMQDLRPGRAEHAPDPDRVAGHVSVDVEDFDAEIARLATLGFHPRGAPKLSRGQRIVTFPPDKTGGIPFQVREAPSRSVGQPQQ